MSIELHGVHKRFGNFNALSDISLSVREGELLALLGPSGSGKTTLLRIIAGLEAADAGNVLIDGVQSGDRTRRGGQVGFVFQHYALFRHLSVFENIAFGLRVRPAKTRPSKTEIEAKVHELLHLVQLEGTGNRYPAQLSGGQRQRVALARALAIEPKVLLLDEPFGALDAQVRQELRQWLRNLHDKLGMTSVFVTHDQEEALEVADRVVVMNKGRVEQIGTPEDVYGSPANPFVYHFLGRVNLFHGRVANGRVRLGALEVGDARDHSENEQVIGYVRPHDLDVSREPGGDGALEAVVRHVHAVGPIVRLDLARRDADDPISAEITRDQYDVQRLVAGETVFVTPRKLGVFPDFDPSI